MSNSNPKLFLSRHYPSIDVILKTKHNELSQKIRAIISEDRILSKLELSHPGEQVFFGSDPKDSDRMMVFNLLEQDPLAYKATLKESGTVGSSWVIGNKPFNWLMSLVIRWYMLNGTEEQLKSAVMYMTVSFYATLQFKYFRRFYQPNIMAAAMNSLSEKFTLKKNGTMIQTIFEISWNSHEKYKDLLKSGSDKDIFNYFQNMWSRLNGVLKSLKKHYEDVKKTGAYLNTSKIKHDDGETVERTTDGGKVMIISDQIVERFASESVNNSIINVAASLSDCPRQNLIVAIGNIRSNNLENVREIIRLILEIYFEERSEGTEGIRTRGFIGYIHAIYMRSNTKDGRIERVKELLDKLLASNSPHYLKTNREATKSAFRKGMYMVIGLYIQQHA